MESLLAWWVWAELCGVCVQGPLAAQLVSVPAAHPGDVRNFDIPPQSLESALELFSHEVSFGFMFDAGKAEGLRSPGVKGTMSTREALQRLVAGTPFVVVDLGGQLGLRPAPGSGEAPRAPSGAARPEAPRSLRQERSDLDWLGGAQPLDRYGMIVTGSHIRQMPDPLSPRVWSWDDQKLEHEGLANISELLDTIPQNFGGGPTEDTILGLEAQTNSARGYTFNLRGLGAGGTLPLLNGRRLAPGGSEGSFVDVASLGLSALGRVDMLPAAASPLYGSEAVGGVVNFVTLFEPGIETLVRTGGATDGGLGEVQISQRVATQWDGGGLVALFEVFDRSSLRADDRALARSDLRPYGGSNFDTPNGNPGTLIDGGIPYAIPEGQDGRSLVAGDLVPGTANLYDLRAGSDLLPEQRRTSGLFSLRHELNESVSLYSDVLVTRRNIEGLSTGVRAPLVVPASNPFFVSPSGSPFVVVNYDLGQDLGQVRESAAVDFVNAAFGARLQLWNGWLLDSYLGYGNEQQDQTRSNVADFDAVALALADPNPATALNPFGDGSHTPQPTLDAIRATQRLGTDSQLASFNVTADGPVATLPGGDVQLALGAEYRAQQFESGNDQMSAGGVTTLRGNFERGVSSVFAELRLPLVGAGNARPALRALELSLSGRYERYEDFGDEAVPGIGLSWSPWPGVTLRGSAAEAYKAPNLADLDQTNNVSQLFALVDPLNPQAGPVPFLLSVGKNADLQEETATNWTAGVDFTPSWMRQLALSLTYFNVDLRNRVQEVASGFPNLADPRIAPFIDRNPTQAARAAVCGRSTFLGASGDCLSAPIAAIADLRIQNSTLTRTSGVDLRLNYARQVGLHFVELDVLATHVHEFEQAFGNGAAVNLLDTQTNPLDFRMRGTLSWDYEGWGATLALNYADAYRDTLSQPNRGIDSFTSLDLQLRREWGRDSGWLSGVRASITVRNLFDESAPFFNNPVGLGYDQENADLHGRTLRLMIAKAWK